MINAAKHFNQFNILFLFIFLFISNIAIALPVYNKPNRVNNFSSAIDSSYDKIRICKWKNDAKTCVNFSFDDGLPSFNEISRIFDKFGYKASFFIIAATMQVDSLKDMLVRGHEIANHSYSHPLFDLLDSTKIDYQIRKGQEMIENALGIKCICFGEPGNFKSDLCSEIAFKYHLFVRHYSQYSDIKRIECGLQQENLANFVPSVKTAISKGILLQVISHGINHDGYLPLTSELIIQELDSIKGYVENGDIWLTTVKEGISYENLFHEVTIDKSLVGDTLKLKFRNYNRDKYKDLEQSILSIEIPYTITKEIQCLTEFVEVKELSDKFILTTDLKRDTCINILLKGSKVELINKFKIPNKYILRSKAELTDNLVSNRDIYRKEVIR